MNNKKEWYKSRTIWVAVLQSLVAIISIWSNIYPEVGGILLAKSFVDILLRTITNKKINL